MADVRSIVAQLKKERDRAAKQLSGMDAALRAFASVYSDKPKRRRKRTEDTCGLFKKLAMKILAPVLRSVFDADDFNWLTPPDELDETQRLLQRERYSQDAMWQQHDNEASHRDQTNHLFPRP